MKLNKVIIDNVDFNCSFPQTLVNIINEPAKMTEDTIEINTSLFISVFIYNKEDPP